MTWQVETISFTQPAFSGVLFSLRSTAHRYCNYLPDMSASSCLSREAGQLIETSPQCRPLNHLLSAGDSIVTLGFEECGYNLKNVLLVKWGIDLVNCHHTSLVHFAIHAQSLPVFSVNTLYCDKVFTLSRAIHSASLSTARVLTPAASPKTELQASSWEDLFTITNRTRESSLHLTIPCSLYLIKGVPYLLNDFLYVSEPFCICQNLCQYLSRVCKSV